MAEQVLHTRGAKHPTACVWCQARHRRTQRDRVHMKVTFYADKKGETRWNMKAGNNRIVADGAEGYSTPAKAVTGFNAVLRVLCGNPKAVEIVNDLPVGKRTKRQPLLLIRKQASIRAGRVRFYKDKAGEFRWQLTASNGSIIADCSEGFKRALGASGNFRKVVDGIGGSRSSLTVVED